MKEKHFGTSMATQATLKYIASWISLPFLMVLWPFFLIFALFDMFRPKWEDQ